MVTKPRIGVNAIIQQDDKILLLRRSPHVWAGGKYCLPAGHVEPGESTLQGLVREVREEIGITVDPADVTCVHVCHEWFNRDDGGCPEYISFYFKVHAWQGEIHNAEPDKHDELVWVRLDQLPENMLSHHAISHWCKGVAYTERGW